MIMDPIAMDITEIKAKTPAEISALRFASELSGMAWLAVLNKYPERRQELRLLWSEILDAARDILHDPDCCDELWKRTQAN